MYGLGGDMSGSLGYAPAGLYGGLDPSASAGAYAGNPLGGGIAGQVAGNQPIADNGSGGMNQILQMMMIQQAMNGAKQIGQQGTVSTTGQQQYAQPQAQISPMMLGAMMNGSR